MPLNDLMLRRASPKERAYRLNDADGLHLIVDPDGKKWWRVDYTFERRRRTISVGRYPARGLAEARAERDEVRRLLALGLDPVKARRTVDDDRTFKGVAQKWLGKQRRTLDPVYADRIATRFDDYVYPFIGAKDIAAVKPTDMIDIVRRLELRGVFQTGRRLNQHCARVFKMAIAEGLAEANPCRDIVAAFEPQPEVRHRASMAPERIGQFLVALDETSIEPLTRDAVLLTILTALRTDEVRFAHRDEFEDLDGAEPLWRLPPARMKLPRAHLVPLSRQAAEIVSRRIALLTPAQTLLFEVPRTRQGVISENRMLEVLYRLGHRGTATMHGFRSSFSTLANNATLIDPVTADERRRWDSDWIERQLAHVEENDVRKAYNAAEYLPQRRKLLQWWADWLDDERKTAALIG